MRVGISNIAWSPEHDLDVARVLKRLHVDAVDVAPGRYFADPVSASASEINSVRRFWHDHGLEITGMQSLLFGTTGLNLFGDQGIRDDMMEYLAGVCRVGAGLGATHLVFGSPRNRDRATLDDDAADAIAIEFFRELGDRAATRGVVVTLEPNPRAYGANFMTTSAEAARIVRLVGHDAIKMQLDLGACEMNGEDVATVVAEHGALVGHIHLSEQALAPFGSGDSDHGAARTALEQSLPDRTACIEMLVPGDTSPLPTIQRAVEFALDRYRDRAH